jgi:hypothetical protein
VSELEIRGVRAGLLLDEPLLLSSAGDDLLWRARYRDDDMRVWRAAAGRAEDLLAALGPAKPSSGPIAALASLRPVQIDVRVEAPDGRAAGRRVRVCWWRRACGCGAGGMAGWRPCCTSRRRASPARRW